MTDVVSTVRRKIDHCLLESDFRVGAPMSESDKDRDCQWSTQETFVYN